MTTHSKYSPSTAHRWMFCAGSMAMPENQVPDSAPTPYADEGTAAHTLAATCLQQHKNATDQVGQVIEVKNDDGTVRSTFTVDDDFALNVQSYIDDVRSRAIGGHLLTEQRVDLSQWLGTETCEACKGTGNITVQHKSVKRMTICDKCKGTGEVPQGGTSDAVIFDDLIGLLTVDDLKFGRGERVWASTGDPTILPHKSINPQVGLYALGSLDLVALLGKVEEVLVIIDQPRIGHRDEFKIAIDDLVAFGDEAAHAVNEAERAQKVYAEQGVNGPDFQFYLTPGTKQCRWCRATATCPKLRAHIEEETRSQFDTITEQPPLAPSRVSDISKAYAALPLISAWCKAVSAEVHRLVATGSQVIGPDGKPLKFVEGELGDRKWSDEALAEAALLGQLGEDKVYKPRAIITASVASKLLDRKKTKALWDEIFVPLITRAKGKPILALGSDTRPPYDNSAKAEEFEELGAPE
jgi:hypothetical protein